MKQSRPWLGGVELAGDGAVLTHRRQFAGQSNSSFRATPPPGAAQKTIRVEATAAKAFVANEPRIGTTAEELKALWVRHRMRVLRQSRRWPCRDFVVVPRDH